MKNLVVPCLIGVLSVTLLIAQEPGNKVPPKSTTPESHPLATRDSDDLQELNADVQRMKILLNQMRTNLAFVQSSQTPLKHQFELETDAWQVMVEQMDRRIRRMEQQSKVDERNRNLPIQAEAASGR